MTDLLADGFSGKNMLFFSMHETKPTNAFCEKMMIKVYSYS
jgi:hypothetical protein